jgi:hypothetical protein
VGPILSCLWHCFSHWQHTHTTTTTPPSAPETTVTPSNALGAATTVEKRASSYGSFDLLPPWQQSRHHPLSSSIPMSCDPIKFSADHCHSLFHRHHRKNRYFYLNFISSVDTGCDLIVFPFYKPFCLAAYCRSLQEAGGTDIEALGLVRKRTSVLVPHGFGGGTATRIRGP